MLDLVITGVRDSYSVLVVEVKSIRDHLFGREQSKVLCQFRGLSDDYLKALRRHYRRRGVLI